MGALSRRTFLQNLGLGGGVVIGGTFLIHNPTVLAGSAERDERGSKLLVPSGSIATPDQPTLVLASELPAPGAEAFEMIMAELDVSGDYGAIDVAIRGPVTGLFGSSLEPLHAMFAAGWPVVVTISPVQVRGR